MRPRTLMPRLEAWVVERRSRGVCTRAGFRAPEGGEGGAVDEEGEEALFLGWAGVGGRGPRATRIAEAAPLAESTRIPDALSWPGLRETKAGMMRVGGRELAS